MKAVSQDTSDPDHIQLKYDWTFFESKGHSTQWSWKLNISNERLEAYKEFPIATRRNYGLMITTNDYTLQEAAGAFENASNKKNYDVFTEASFVLSFVQSLEYTSDKVTTGYDEYPRFPLETLADHGGDCEDTSVLYATIMILLGYDAVLFLIIDEDSNTGHMAVGIALEGESGYFIQHQSKKYYYAETTGENWRIGQIPDEYKGATIQVLEFSGKQYDPDNPPKEENELEFWLSLLRMMIIALTIMLILILIYNYIHSRIKKSTKNNWPNDDHEEEENIYFKRKNPIDYDQRAYGSGYKSSKYDDYIKPKSRHCSRCGTDLYFDNFVQDWWCGPCRSYSHSQDEREKWTNVNDYDEW